MDLRLAHLYIVNLSFEFLPRPFWILRNCLMQLTIFQNSLQSHNIDSIIQVGSELKALLKSMEMRTVPHRRPMNYCSYSKDYLFSRSSSPKFCWVFDNRPLIWKFSLSQTIDASHFPTPIISMVCYNSFIFLNTDYFSIHPRWRY